MVDCNKDIMTINTNAKKVVLPPVSTKKNLAAAGGGQEKNPFFLQKILIIKIERLPQRSPNASPELGQRKLW